MTGGLGLDIYVEMTSPRMRVTVEEGVDSRLEVRIGAPHTSLTGETSTVHLWFKRPDAVIKLGNELVLKGQAFLDQVADEVEPQSGGGSDAG